MIDAALQVVLVVLLATYAVLMLVAVPLMLLLGVIALKELWDELRK